MNLDDLTRFQSLDSQNLIAQINEMPQQLQDAWESGQSLPLPEMPGLRSILIAGMGGSAMGAEILAAYAAPVCPIPIVIHREYDLPEWARGPETLAIAISHSGNTEETLDAFGQALARGCRVLAVAAGGKLAQRGQESGVPLWQYSPNQQPRTAVGVTYGLLLALLHRLGLLPDPTEELHDTLHAMRNQQTNLRAEAPIAFNPAKRMAGQLVGRSVTIFAAEAIEPVARRWKTLINENAKALAQFEYLPEADHNTLAGLNNPEQVLMQTMTLFLTAPSNTPRNLLRLDTTRQLFMMQGINTDFIEAKGDSRMAHIWTLLHFGDYTSYYLAMAYGEDPTPVDAITALKDEMGKASTNKRNEDTSL